jgi:hypothetical protein
MAKTVAIYQPKSYALGVANFENADGTASKLVFTAGADDSTLKSLSATSTDTSNRIAKVILKTGGTEYILGTFTIPLGAGTDGTTPAVDLLDLDFLPIDRNTKKVLPLEAGTEVRVAMATAVTAAKVIAITATAEDF